MNRYKHLFFDLDRTLWDFDSNSYEALKDIYENHGLASFFEHPDEFISTYHRHNERLWAEYRDGNLTKSKLRSVRFLLTLKEKKINDPYLAEKIGEEYLRLSVLKTNLFPCTHEILEYLQPSYNLYILTNGFRETQFKKMKNSGLEKYFKHVFTSETIGYNKPHLKIFQWAISSVNARKEECLMIGDDQKVDIAGGNAYGIDTVFFNPLGENQEIPSKYTINRLDELKEFL